MRARKYADPCTILPAASQPLPRDTGNGEFELGILQDDGRSGRNGLEPKLPWIRPPQEFEACPLRPGPGNERHLRVTDQGSVDLRAAGHHIDNAGRQAFVGLGQPQVRQGRNGRRFAYRPRCPPPAPARRSRPSRAADNGMSRAQQSRPACCPETRGRDSPVPHGPGRNTGSARQDSKHAAAQFMQSTDSLSGLPVSRVISADSAVQSARMRAPTSARSRPLSAAGSRRQSGWAALAAASAHRASSSPPSDTIPTGSRVAGLSIRRVAPDPASIHAPSINRVCMSSVVQPAPVL